jgi:hypothetical protein
LAGDTVYFLSDVLALAGLVGQLSVNVEFIKSQPSNLPEFSLASNSK